MSVEKQEAREPCCSKLKLFLVSLSAVFFAKAFQGSYMKSSVTQIERRFDISSSLIGFIDGSFEVGNLLMIAFVSYFGAKLHRPRLIGVGCLIMAIGSFITAMPHFFQGKYVYETTISHQVSETNETEAALPCLPIGGQTSGDKLNTAEGQAECERAAGSSMWIYVLLGNMLRGIGETPVMPLGLSYLDDFSKEENTALYLACVQTIGILGPMFGFMLGSFCAKLYVDIGAVDLDSISITHKDTRWVGAWWLGFLVTGVFMLLAGIPFWFLPRSLSKQGGSRENNSNEVKPEEQDAFIPTENKGNHASEKHAPVNMMALARDFLPSLRRLFRNPIYLLMICTGLVQVSGFIGMITFKPKFMEQVYGQSASKVIFLIGIMNLPAVALGIISGGFIMKRLKLSVIGAGRICIFSGSVSFCLLVAQYFVHCENSPVAGLTLSYQGVTEVSNQPQSLLSQCNTGCSCSLNHWDPVCSSNGVTYATPCLAGCQSSTGVGKEMTFHNCSCVTEAQLPATNMSVTLGQCSRNSDCERMFKFYMAVSVIGAFFSACGATPGYVILLRSIQPDLKSLALGMQMLIVRALGGIPPPIYFGALIDKTCLKWGTKRCGGRGACRIYNANAFRTRFLGLVYSLYGLSFLLWVLLYNLVSRNHRRQVLQEQANGTELGTNGTTGGSKNNSGAIVKCKEELDKEMSI